mgnify:CR=1 FL=1
MLHVVDNLLPSDRLDALKQLCEAHDALKQNHPGDALFSWRPDQGRCRSVHRPEHLRLIEDYLTDHLLPVATPFSAGHCGVEWWCNTNNDLDWHIDKDEAEGRTSGAYVLPLLSTVFYPHVSCAGGELLVADNPPVAEGYTGPLPVFRSVISIPPVRNRLVLFSPGILHRINPLEGERYSLAVNIWGHEPITTSDSAPLV